ncbi:hypothetical protein RRG08_007518 [Elysia crispata]|uniref:Uncharacterized protein n=1 Tax=Elysia crispata TaxID=231223 RepID=A0AAE1DPA0_9GAST|nr:hypothetical protein RRG08_007518 [Elysia crispata]
MSTRARENVLSQGYQEKVKKNCPTSVEDTIEIPKETITSPARGAKPLKKSLQARDVPSFCKRHYHWPVVRATISKPIGEPRSYIIETPEGTTLRRNRVHSGKKQAADPVRLKLYPTLVTTISETIPLSRGELGVTLEGPVL